MEGLLKQIGGIHSKVCEYASMRVGFGLPTYSHTYLLFSFIKLENKDRQGGFEKTFYFGVNLLFLSKKIENGLLSVVFLFCLFAIDDGTSPVAGEKADREGGITGAAR